MISYVKRLLRVFSISDLISVVRWIGPRWRILTVAFIVDLATAGGDLAMPLSLKFLVDGLRPSGPSSTLLLAVLLIAAAGIIRFGTGIVSSRLYTLVSEQSGVSLRTTLSRTILSASPLSLRTKRTGDLVSCVLNDCGVLQQILGSSLVNVLMSVIRASGFIVMMMWLDPQLATVVVAFTMVSGALVAAGTLSVKQAAMQVQDALAHTTSTLNESFEAIDEIQLLNGKERAIKDLEVAFNKTADARVRQVLMESVLGGITSATIFACVAVVLWLGGKGVIAGKITVGTLVAFANYACNSFAPVNGVIQGVGGIIRALGANERILNFSTSLEDHPLRDGLSLLRERTQTLSFENVSFAYPSEEACSVDNVSVSFAANETAVIMGPNGSGKSTFLGLIPRLYDPCSGRVLINGRQATEFALTSLREHIGLVGRAGFLVRGTIGDNVRFGLLSCSDDDVLKALQLAEAAELSGKLGGLRGEVIGPGGRALSTGERQRVALARLFLRQPDIVILDEALSSIDAASRVRILENFRSMGALVLLVNHDYHSEEKLTRVLHMQEGKMIEAFGREGEQVKTYVM